MAMPCQGKCQKTNSFLRIKRFWHAADIVIGFTPPHPTNKLHASVWSSSRETFCFRASVNGFVLVIIIGNKHSPRVASPLKMLSIHQKNFWDFIKSRLWSLMCRTKTWDTRSGTTESNFTWKLPVSIMQLFQKETKLQRKCIAHHLVLNKVRIIKFVNN